MTALVGQGASERDQLSRLNALLVLAMLMTESTDEQQILRMGASAAPSFADCRLVGTLTTDGRRTSWTPGDTGLSQPRDLASLPPSGGQVEVPGEPWAWAYPLGSASSSAGLLVVAADDALDSDAQFMLRVLGQQIGSAVRNSRLHQAERTAVDELAMVNQRLGQTVEALEQRIDIHHRLTRAAVEAEGMESIAKAIHDVTGLPAAIEDRYGNLRAWAGPNQPTSYPKDPSARREQLLRRLLREGHPLRESGKVMIVASPRPDSVAVISLIDPEGASRDVDLAALEYGSLILSMELARQRSVADTEVRIRRDLVEDLLAGTSPDNVLARGEAFQRDLTAPHRVVVFEGRGRIRDDEQFFTAVRRAARDLGLGSLLVARAGTVVLLADHDIGWDDLHAAVMRELPGGQCRIGVGGRTSSVADFPNSHREAMLALQLQRTNSRSAGVTVFDELGVYRLLAGAEDPEEIERFVEEWLGPLLKYDRDRRAELVLTLHQYLECGGRYDETAATLSIHRSTLKYRLQRIRDVGGMALGDPNVNFNLQLACRAWRTLQVLKG